MIRGVQSCTPCTPSTTLRTRGFHPEEGQEGNRHGGGRQAAGGGMPSAPATFAPSGGGPRSNLGWDPERGWLIMITQTPDYFLPRRLRRPPAPRALRTVCHVGCRPGLLGLPIRTVAGIEHDPLRGAEAGAPAARGYAKPLLTPFRPVRGPLVRRRRFGHRPRAGEGAAETSWHFVMRTDSRGLEI